MTKDIDTIAALNRRFSKNCTWSIGWSQRCSHQAKPASTARLPQIAARTRGELQERSGASMIPQSRSPSPAMELTAPIGSAGFAAWLREFGTSHAVATRPAAAIGTLMRKTDPHQ